MLKKFIIGWVILLGVILGTLGKPRMIPTGTNLPATIESPMTLTQDNSPYVANSNVTVISGVKLTVEAGVVIQFAQGAGLYIEGQLEMKGREWGPIVLEPKSGHPNWDILSLVDPSGLCVIEYVNISGTTLGDNPGREQAAITAYKADDLLIDHVNFTDNYEPLRIVSCDNVTIQYSSFYCDKAGSDYLNFAENSSGLIQYCEFIGNDKDNCDAIDFDFSTALIHGNIIYGFSGDNSDGIDIGGDDSNVIITENRISDMSDKGISIGEQSRALVERNIVFNAAGGIVSKDLAVVTANNNTVFNCEVGVSGTSIPKVNYGGGILYVTNTIIDNCDQSFTSEHNSTVTINYCISDAGSMSGTGNIYRDPRLVDPGNGDFSLQADSPAIDSGDPTSPNDPDGTRSDMGAIPFTHEGYYNIAITEINYRPLEDGSENPPYEFIEILNREEESIDLGGVSISGAISYTFMDGTLISPGEYIIVAKSALVYENMGYQVYQWFSGQLSNEGDVLVVSNSDGQVLMELEYDDQNPWPILPSLYSYSIEMNDVSDSPNNADNWRLSYDPNGTPGRSGKRTLLHDLVINELTAKAGTYYADEYGDYSDWIEIFNKGDQHINLGGLYVTNDLEEPDLYLIPDDQPNTTTLAPGQFILLFADEDPDKGVFHLNFTLKSGGGEVGLTQLTQTGYYSINEITYPSQAINISYGRYPNGGLIAEYFEVPTPGSPNARAEDLLIEDLVINEFAAKVENKHPDEFGLYSDWIEIYNKGDIAIDMGGLWFSDNPDNFLSHQISMEYPDSTLIESGGFHVFRADQLPNLGIDHLDFRLASSGECIVLVQELWGYNRIIDSIKYPPQTVDISYGRINDGELGWQYYPISTPGKSNGSTASELFPISDNLDFFVYPNPASEQINIHFSGDWIEKRKIIIRICDLNGQVLTEQLVKREQLMNTGIHNISIAEFSNGFKYCGIVFVQVITDDLTQVKRLLIVQ